MIDLVEQIESNQIYKRLVLSLLESDNLDEILWKIIEDAISKLSIEDCVVYILEDQDILVQKAAYGPKNPDGRIIATPITIPLGQGIVGTVAKTGVPERITDTRLDARYIVDDEVRLSELTVPIIYNGKVLGVLDSENSQANYFTENHLEQFITIAQLAAPQIFNALTKEHLSLLNKTLQDSSTRYRELIEHCPEAILVHQNGRIIYHNPAFTSLVLHKPGESLLQRNLKDFFIDEQFVTFQKSLTNMRGNTAWCEIEMTTSYCTKVNVEATSLKIPVQDGEATQTIFHDITTYKRKELELITATREAENANLVKSQFLSRMSHELRTPLNAIIGFAQIQQIKFPDLPEEIQYQNQEILSASQHLLALVNDILDITRIEQKKLKIRLVNCDLSAALESSISLIKSGAETKNISINTNNVDYQVLADPTRLKQVFVNLLSNAVKYNHPGGKVTIQVARVKESGVEIRISDTGIGIPEEKMGVIFEPFTRLKQAEQHQFEGAGIGLSLTKALLQEMQGTIQVESVPEQGTTFIVNLASDEQEASKSKNEPQKPTFKVFDQIALSVLYVEDNPASAELVRSVFAMFPRVNLSVTNTANEGIALACDSDFDLIILDINLPDMTGIEALNQLRQKGQQCQIIALSADALPEQVDLAMAAGFDFYLTKPLQISELSSYLRLVNKERIANKALT